MATNWAESLIPLYDNLGAVIEVNKIPPQGQTWEIKKSHIATIRTAVELLMVRQFGTLPDAWAAFYIWCQSKGKVPYNNWRSNDWTKYNLSFIQDLRDTVLFLEESYLKPVTSWADPNITCLYDVSGNVIDANRTTYTPVRAQHLIQLRTAVNSLENWSGDYRCFDFSPFSPVYVDTPLVIMGGTPNIQINGIFVKNDNTLFVPEKRGRSVNYICDGLARSWNMTFNDDPNCGYPEDSNRNTPYRKGSIQILPQEDYIANYGKDNSVYATYPNCAVMRCWNVTWFNGAWYKDARIRMQFYGIGFRVFKTLSVTGWAVENPSGSIPVHLDNYWYYTAGQNNTYPLVDENGNPFPPPDPYMPSDRRLKFNPYNLSGFGVGCSLPNKCNYREVILSSVNQDHDIKILDNPTPEFVWGCNFYRIGIITKGDYTV